MNTEFTPAQPAPQAPAHPAQARREALYTVLAQVPSGRVVSYGQLAALAGLGRAARWVGHTLARLPADTQLPWHRVVGAGGRLSLPPENHAAIEQCTRLRAEGIQVQGRRVDMRRHGWHPDACRG